MSVWGTLKAWTGDPFHLRGGRYYEAADGGRRGRRRTHAPQGGPNVGIITEGAPLRDSSYALERNEPFVWNGINALCAMLVGTGIQPESQITDPVLKQQVHELWDDWCDECDADGRTDFYGLQALALRAMLMGGDALARKRPRLASDGLSVPLQIQVLESAMLPLNWNQANGANLIRAGIELGPIGQRVAYWIYPMHPADFQLTGLASGLVNQPVRIPAEQIIHLQEISRPGQLRGEPRLARLIVPASDFHAGEDALQKAWNIAAAIGGTIEVTNPEFVPAQRPDDKPNDKGELVMEFEPGTWIPLNPGETMNQAKAPEVGATYAVATKLRLQRIAAGFGLPYDTVSKDNAGASYAQSRSGLVQAWSECDQFLWQTMVPQWCTPLWRWFFDDAVASGALPIAAADYAKNRRKYQRVSWNPPQRAWVDPLKDIQADILGIEAGILSRDEVIRGRGRNPAQVDLERKASRERAAQLGVTDEAAVSVRGPTLVEPGTEPNAVPAPGQRTAKPKPAPAKAA